MPCAAPPSPRPGCCDMTTDTMLGTNHQWSAPDEDGVRRCTKSGCTVRVRNHYSMWQRRKGAHWRVQAWDLIPDCKGETP